MQTVRFDGHDMPITAAPWTVVVYEDEFGGDMVADLKAYMQGDSKDENLHLTAYLKALWAMAKTANPALSGYRAWVRSLSSDALDLGGDIGWLGGVMEEFQHTFFRDATGDEAKQG